MSRSKIKVLAYFEWPDFYSISSEFPAGFHHVGHVSLGYCMINADICIYLSPRMICKEDNVC